MYADAVARISESIFPIFFTTEQDGAVAMGVCGTGFFIADGGLFMTVDHIMHCAPPGSSYLYYGKVPDWVCTQGVEIECVARDPVHDLYIGHVQRDELQPVEFSNEAVRPGDSVCLSGYPMAVVAPKEDGGFIGSVRRYWQPTYAIDAAQASIEGRLYDGYIVQHPCYPGMSGAPVCDMSGRVRGMSVANLSRSMPDPGGASLLVSNGIVADVERIQRFARGAGVSPR